MEISDAESKRLTEAFERLTRDVANVHRDVRSIAKRVLPDEKVEEGRKGRWPAVKSARDIQVALAWLSAGFESLQHDLRLISARMDVVINDSHAFDEMKEHLKRPPPRDRKDG